MSIMDTIIDTRQFPKEMGETPSRPQEPKKTGRGLSLFFWVILFLAILFGFYYFYKNMGNTKPIVSDVEKQNEFIQEVVKNKKPLPSPTYERGVSHLFGE